MALAQDSLPHSICRVAYRHLPAPSHMPSVPQGCAPGLQSLWGSAPFWAGAQVPSGWPVRTRAQALQAPEQAVAQQSSSTHWPLAH